MENNISQADNRMSQFGKKLKFTEWREQRMKEYRELIDSLETPKLSTN